MFMRKEALDKVGVLDEAFLCTGKTLIYRLDFKRWI